MKHCRSKMFVGILGMVGSSWLFGVNETLGWTVFLIGAAFFIFGFCFFASFLDE